ncbi:MAG: trypsin-like peptidase domain-containing protein, partial [Planctomycetales bacterium]|nr:trypsin-like peptidase domain-containing protein [Planctomycetales bacterium]
MRFDPPPWFDEAIAQICDAEGRIWGVGVVLDDRRVLTCAHVVADALSSARGEVLADSHVGRELSVSRPWFRHDDRVIAKIVDFRTIASDERGVYDLAILERNQGSFQFSYARPRFVDGAELAGQGILVRGFPADTPETGFAASAEYTLTDRNPNGWMSAEASKGHGNEIRAGFSGAPAWGLNFAAIVGIVSFADADRRTAVIIPASILRQFVPELMLVPPIESNVEVQTPSSLRRWLDERIPSLHRKLTEWGILKVPADRGVITEHLKEVAATARNAVESKRRFIVLNAIDTRGTVPALMRRDRVLSPIQQVIREIIGMQGGDSATAEIASYTRKSRRVRDIVRRLLKTEAPLVLLGEPGAGKSLTLQQTLHSVANRELQKQFPTACLMVRLGEFYRSGSVTESDVWDYLKNRPEAAGILHLMEGLREAGRLLVMFDGIDEMSRRNYNEHLTALSIFADKQQPTHVGQWSGVRTLFSCRVADFTAAFQHQRLVLLPFRLGQVLEYLEGQDGLFPLRIENHDWTPKSLATYLIQADLPVEPTNPFVLWMLCQYLKNQRAWPNSRVALLRHTAEITYSAKLPGKSETLRNEDFAAWARLALEITLRNTGGAILLEEAKRICDPEGGRLDRGKACGILIESRGRTAGEEQETFIRFDHHRWQEYFAAVRLADPGVTETASNLLADVTAIDSQRLQETLINLALLAGGIDLFIRLTDFVEREVNCLDPAEPKIPLWDESAANEPIDQEESLEASETLGEQTTQEIAPTNTGESSELSRIGYLEEALLADRLDFVARLIASSSRERLAEVSDRLGAAFEHGLNELVKNGRPVTQVKLLNAARRAKANNLHDLAETVYRSKARWARNQAIAVLSMDHSGLGDGRSLEAEIAQSVAAGDFPRRLPDFAVIAKSVKNRRAWLLMSAGLVVSLISIIAPVAIVLGARLTITRICERRVETNPGLAVLYESDRFEEFLNRRVAEHASDSTEHDEERTALLLGTVSEHRIASHLLRDFSTPLWWIVFCCGMFFAVVAALVFDPADGSDVFPAWSGVAIAGFLTLALPILWHLAFTGVGAWSPIQIVAGFIGFSVATVVLTFVVCALVCAIDAPFVILLVMGTRFVSGKRIPLVPLLESMWEAKGYTVMGEILSSIPKNIGLYVFGFFLASKAGVIPDLRASLVPVSVKNWAERGWSFFDRIGLPFPTLVNAGLALIVTSTMIVSIVSLVQASLSQSIPTRQFA